MFEHENGLTSLCTKCMLLPFKVRLLRFGAILWDPSILSIYMSLCNIFIVIIIKRQMIELHDDIGIIIMTSGILVKMNSEIEK